MAGIALVLDLLSRNQKLPSQSLHSFASLSATVAASLAAATAAAARPRFLFGDGGISVAYCDAAVSQNELYIPDLRNVSENLLNRGSFHYRTKEYPLEIKPLFSAFELKSFTITSVRSFLLFYLPLLEPRTPVEEDDDFLQDAAEEKPVDLVVPFQNSVKQIIRETTIVTIRRMLERFAVHHCSQRMAWKLLKDVPKSAKRKAERGMSSSLFCFSVSRTTFRGHMLGVAASWIVQIGIDAYRCFIRKPSNDNLEVEMSEKIRIFGRKLYGTTVKCSASLVFASIGAGIGGLFHPTAGQWIGCALGDFGGPVIVVIIFEKLHLAL